jgi:hypothetical protein
MALLYFCPGLLASALLFIGTRTRRLRLTALGMHLFSFAIGAFAFASWSGPGHMRSIVTGIVVVMVWSADVVFVVSRRQGRCPHAREG